MDSFSDVEQAKKAYGKKFQDKTKNKWDDRANFNPAPGKYTLIEVEAGDDSDMEETVKKVSSLCSMKLYFNGADCEIG